MWSYMLLYRTYLLAFSGKFLLGMIFGKFTLDVVSSHVVVFSFCVLGAMFHFLSVFFSLRGYCDK